MGDRADIGVLTQQVSDYSTDVGTAAAAKGSHWVAARVRSCNDELPKRLHGTAFSSSFWYLEDPWGEQYSASSSGPKRLPFPRYPVSGPTLHRGECVAGWIVFEVPDGSVPPKWVVNGFEEDVYAKWVLR